MKRVGLALLLFILIAVFSTSAMAVDVKFSGEYYAAGLYLDKTTFRKNTASDGPSTAFYFQRLRLNTEFTVAPGLTLTTRADIMERVWGAARSAPGMALDTLSAGTRAENENIAFDLVYVSYTSPIGMFSVGYKMDGQWGTVFADYFEPMGKIGHYIQYGSWTTIVEIAKANGGERSLTAINPTTAADRDGNIYQAGIIYAWKTGQAGFLGRYVREAGNRNLGIPGMDAGFTTNAYILLPYAKASFGPLVIQSEFNYLFGQAAKWEGSFPFGNLADTRLEQYAAWLDASVDFGRFYVGGSVAYVSGDDPGTGQIEGSNLTGMGLTGGQDWNPCLILFNSDLTYWAGNETGYGGQNAGPMTNAWFFQVRGGLRPIEKIDVMMSASYANADKKPAAAWLYNDYGYEIDVIATYKITNNLSYLLGAGYLFTGKYYKGVSDVGTDLANNYLVINKLALKF